MMHKIKMRLSQAHFFTWLDLEPVTLHVQARIIKVH